eukprot:COSAG02_NODE_175_length_31226_cov_95.275934_2_plen_76_part_00
MGAVWIAISVETSLNRPFPGTKLDMPRLDPPRGPARGRARANLRDLMSRSSSTIASARAGRARGHAISSRPAMVL